MTTANHDYPVTLDWVDTLNAWREVFQPLRRYETRHRLPGVNLVTSEHMATYQFGPWLVELSTGTFPALGERPRREYRVFGCSVNWRGLPDVPARGAMVEADTMTDVLARWWDTAMTGIAAIAYDIHPDLEVAETRLRRYLTGPILEDALAKLPSVASQGDQR
jgi:hypothetical protein